MAISGGELFLISNIAVVGTPSWLHRFSYQANVIVDVDEPLISGTISRAAVTANVASTASAASMNRIDDLFTITAVVDLPPAVGSLGGATKPVALVEVTGALLEDPQISIRASLEGFRYHTSSCQL